MLMATTQLSASDQFVSGSAGLVGGSRSVVRVHTAVSAFLVPTAAATPARPDTTDQPMRCPVSVLDAAEATKMSGWVVKSDAMSWIYPQAAALKLGQTDPMSDNTTIGDISINYLAQGDPADPPILMIMGLGAQRVSWPPEFVEALVARGRYVITFDNRDAGESTHLHDSPVDLGELVGAMMGGDPLANVPYNLSDMASDARAVLDAVGLERAHIIGASMGGMIAQALVLEYPERALSLTSVFSTTGEPELGGPTAEAAAALITPVPEDREGYIAATTETWKIWSAPEHWDEAEVRARLEREYDRSFDPPAVMRQLAAILASGSRADDLPNIAAPTLVIHGLADTLVQPDGGRRTAELIPGAELLEIPDMGHELPEVHWDVVLDAVAALTAAG